MVGNRNLCLKINKYITISDYLFIAILCAKMYHVTYPIVLIMVITRYAMLFSVRCSQINGKLLQIKFEFRRKNHPKVRYLCHILLIVWKILTKLKKEAIFGSLEVNNFLKDLWRSQKLTQGFQTNKATLKSS